MSSSAVEPLDQLDLSSIGRWTDWAPWAIDRDRVTAFARATNDGNPARLNGECVGPVFAVLAAWTTAYPLLLDLLTPAWRLRTVHGEQDIQYLGRLVPDSRVATRSSVVEANSTSAGVTITGRAFTVDWNLNPVLDQYTTLFIKGAVLDQSVGEGAPPRRSTPARRDDDPSYVDRVTPGQTHAFAEVSGDHEPIHLDDTAARAAGFRAMINHGNCTFAIAAGRVVEASCGGDVSRLRRLAVRFSRPVYIGDELTTTIATGGVADGSTVGWETALPDRTLCLSQGYAEIASENWRED